MVPRSFSLSRLASFLLIALMATVSVPSGRGQQTLPNHLTKRVVADYGYWSKYQTPAYGAPQIPYHMLTHINHAGVGFDATGTLSVPSGPQNEFLEPELNNIAHAKGVKVLLLIGGDFPGLEASGEVQTLVDNIAAFETQHHYDGVDLDWEYPATTGDRKFLVDLAKRLRQSNPDYVLSIDAAVEAAKSGVHCWRATTRTCPSSRNRSAAQSASLNPTPSSPRSVCAKSTFG